MANISYQQNKVGQAKERAGPPGRTEGRERGGEKGTHTHTLCSSAGAEEILARQIAWGCHKIVWKVP